MSRSIRQRLNEKIQVKTIENEYQRLLDKNL